MIRQRRVLVHYHIFKNAGTSVDHALELSFGTRWTTFEGRHAADVLTADQLRVFLEQSPTIAAVSSHLARPPLPWPSCLPIVFIRHPLDRVRSVYDFVAADPTQPHSAVARDRGFRGYVEWALENGPGIVIRNYQTVHLSAATFGNDGVMAEARGDDLIEACERLLSWPAVGIVDRYELSLQLFQQLYAPYAPDLRLEPVRLNAQRRGPVALGDRVAAMRAELGDTLMDRLEAANALDLELYALAARHFVSLCATYDLWPERRPAVDPSQALLASL